MCQHLDPIWTDTHFVILIHPMEFKKEKNGTGIFTKLQLKNSRLIMGVNFSEDNQVNQLINDPQNQCYLLYPGDDVINLSVDDKKVKLSSKRNVVFIIDGTWACAKKMIKLSKNLHYLPRLSFNSNIQSRFIIKQQPNAACLSTIESTKVLLDCLNKHDLENCPTDNFLKPFDMMLAYQKECIDNPPPNSYRSSGQGIIQEKKMYKKANGRKLFFDLNEHLNQKYEIN